MSIIDDISRKAYDIEGRRLEIKKDNPISLRGNRSIKITEYPKWFDKYSFTDYQAANTRLTQGHFGIVCNVVERNTNESCIIKFVEHRQYNIDPTIDVYKDVRIIPEIDAMMELEQSKIKFTPQIKEHDHTPTYGICVINDGFEDKLCYFIIMEKVTGVALDVWFERKFEDYYLSTNNLPTIPPNNTGSVLKYINSLSESKEDIINGIKKDKYFSARNRIISKVLKIILPHYAQLANNLNHIHSHSNRKYIHCDIKPENMKVNDNENNKIYLLDWGSAMKVESSMDSVDPLSSTCQFAPPAPFILGGSTRGASAAFDVFSLCASLYKIITGEFVYSDPRRCSETDLKTPDTLRQELSSYGINGKLVETLVDGLTWTHSPEKQIKSADELSKRLSNIAKIKKRVIISSISAVALITLVISAIVLMPVLTKVPINAEEHKIVHDQYPEDNILQNQWEDENAWLAVYNFCSNKEDGPQIATNNILKYYNGIAINGDMVTTLYVDTINLENAVDFYSGADGNSGEYYYQLCNKSQEYDPITFTDKPIKGAYRSLNDLPKYIDNLQTLILQNCDLSECDLSFDKFPVLKTIIINNCTLPAIKSFSGVECVYINSSNSIPVDISCFSKAKYLTIHGVDVNLNGLDSLTSLKLLDLRNCKYNATDLAKLNCKETLSFLYLNKINNEHITVLSNKCNVNYFFGGDSDYTGDSHILADFLCENTKLCYAFLDNIIIDSFDGFEKLKILADTQLKSLSIRNAQNTNSRIRDYTPFTDYIDKVMYTLNSERDTEFDPYTYSWIKNIGKEYDLTETLYQHYQTVIIDGTNIQFSNGATANSGNKADDGNHVNEKKSYLWHYVSDDGTTEKYYASEHIPVDPDPNTITSLYAVTELFPQVRRLVIKNCAMKLDENLNLSKFKYLEDLCVDNIGVVDCNAFKGMNNLKTLRLSSTMKVVNPEALSLLPNLNYLEISQTNFKISDLPTDLHLREFDVAFCSLDDEDFDYISKLNLDTLSFCYIKEITNDSLLKAILSNKNLVEIFLYNVTDNLDGFDQLSNLEKLWLIVVDDPDLTDWSPLDFFEYVGGRPSNWERRTE